MNLFRLQQSWIRLILQIETCLSNFLVNPTSDDNQPITQSPEAVAGMGSPSGMTTKISSKGMTLGANQLDMDIIICQIARIMSTLCQNASSDAHGQQQWWSRISIAATGSRSYCSRDAEKLVGSPVYIAILLLPLCLIYFLNRQFIFCRCLHSCWCSV